jgi:hypothetical protein
MIAGKNEIYYCHIDQGLNPGYWPDSMPGIPKYHISAQ